MFNHSNLLEMWFDPIQYVTKLVGRRAVSANKDRERSIRSLEIDDFDVVIFPRCK
jgi:hypothetical protein